jgi:hypothetical protein
MYETPVLRRYGTFEQLTQNGPEAPDDAAPAHGVGPGCRPGGGVGSGCPGDPIPPPDIS